MTQVGREGKSLPSIFLPPLTPACCGIPASVGVPSFQHWYPLPGNGNGRWAARFRVASLTDLAQLPGAGVILFLGQAGMGVGPSDLKPRVRDFQNYFCELEELYL